MTEQRTLFTIPAEHPALAGHFPGNPIVPGVLLLAEVMRALEPVRPTGIAQAKFLSPLRPGETCELALRETPTRIDFECHVGASVVARGVLRVGDAA